MYSMQMSHLLGERRSWRGAGPELIRQAISMFLCQT